MVLVGVAIGFALFALFKLPAGSHVYVLAPLAVSVVLAPEHIVPVPAVVAVMVGVAVTVTISVVEPEQPPLSPTKVYVVFEVGLTVIVGAESPLGDHV